MRRKSDKVLTESWTVEGSPKSWLAEGLAGDLWRLVARSQKVTASRLFGFQPGHSRLESCWLALQRLISISRARQLWGQCVDLHNVSDHIIMVLSIVIALMRISQDGQHGHDVSRSGEGTHHRVSRAIWQEGIVWVSDSPA